MEASTVNMMKALLDNLSDVGAVIIDENMQVVDLNATVERCTGKSCDELIGKSFLDCFDDGLAAKHKEAFDAAVSSGEEQIVETNFDGRFIRNVIRPLGLSLGNGKRLFALYSYNVSGEVNTKTQFEDYEAKIANAQYISKLVHWEWDAERNSLVFPDYIYELLHISRDIDVSNPDEFFSVIDEEDFRRLFNGKASVDDIAEGNVEFSVVGRDMARRIFCLESHYHDIGKGRKLYGIIQDISIRKSIENRLKQSEETARLLIDTLDLQSFLVKPDGTILAVNRLFVEFMKSYDSDITAGEIVGKKLYDFVRVGEDTVMQRLNEVSYNRKHYKYEDKFVYGDITEIFVTNVYPIFDANEDVSRIAIFIRNITAEREREQHLSKLRRMESIINECATGVLNPERKNIEDNIESALQQVSGLIKVEHAFIFEFNDKRNRMSCTYEWCAEGVEPQVLHRQNLHPALFTYSMRLMEKSELVIFNDIDDVPTEAAQERNVFFAAGAKSVILQPMRSGDSLAGFVGFASMSRKRNWDVEDVQFVGMLNRTLVNIIIHKRLTEEEQRYARFLENSNEEIRGFTQVITHDLRAPLANIKGFAYEIEKKFEIIKNFYDDVKAKLPNEYLDNVEKVMEKSIPSYLGFINSSAKKMEYLTESVLKWSRAGRRELDYEMLDMNLMIKDILQALEHKIHEKKIKVKKPKLYPVLGDKEAFSQIFSNLIDNAVKYMDKKSGGQITIENSRKNNKVVFTIKDNGPGIKNRDVKDIFRMFKRSGDQKVQGEGIGLAYVKTLTERHDGDISCESEYGSGTTFTLGFPDDSSESK